MIISWFAMFRDAKEASPDVLQRLEHLVAHTPGVAKVLIYTPSSTSDPYLNDGPPPTLGLQLDFSDIAHLEAACGSDGHLHGLAAIMPGADVAEQAMLTRRFLAADASDRAPEPHCTYLVSYEGEAEDANAWLAHYIANHPPIMKRFPGIREIEISTRIDWCGCLPFRRVNHLQRNKVVFDSPEALTAALNSPVRHEMRADFKKFPPFSGANTHFPMQTRSVTPRAGASP